MRAAVVRFGPGPREIVLRDDEPAPVPGPGEVLVRVEACGLNRSDLHLLDGRLSVAAERDLIGGSEIVGQVVDRALGALGPPAGTRVLCDSNRSCGRCRECAAGQENRCRRAPIAGVGVPGGLAEYAVAPAHTVVEVPKSLTAVDAAAVALSGMTAWHALHTRARVRAGETALVMSAGSAVGTLAVQIAKGAGAFVIATTVAAKAEQIAELGADLVIDREHESVRDAVLSATGGAGADVVVDHVGGTSLELGVRCAARGGRVVSCGATQGRAISIDVWKLFSKEIAIIGCLGATRAEIAQLFAEVAAGRVRPVLAGTYPLLEVAAAYAALRDEGRAGKVVVVIG
jgi:NADPH:quinone reductase-like Zn-dependent oxidoreductase